MVAFGKVGVELRGVLGSLEGNWEEGSWGPEA